MPKIDLAKRRRIMQRSQKLGHCVCDPRKPCPCDVFREQGICPCAGERPEPIDLSSIRLTQMVHNAGCASKIAPADLEAVLSRLKAPADPAVISGIPAGDDAAVYKISDDLYLVQTVDVMTPCCDDPYQFGRICAANCISDICAMGGVPRTALSILAFPSETLDGRIMYEMLRGAMETMAQAGVTLIGGHSIKDQEIKLGFAITGTVEAARVTGNDAARVGDVMVLTKPLGTGVLGFARQIGRPVGDFAAAVEAMATLNIPAAAAAAAAGASACTDVTGFGLLGHLMNVARHSGVTAEVWADELPAFGGVLEAIAQGIIPGAVERNTEFVGDALSVAAGADAARVTLGFDAQTSGGLLIFVPPERLDTLLNELSRRNVPAYVVGQVTEKSEGRISVTAKKANQSQNAHASQAKSQGACCSSPAGQAQNKGACCSGAAPAEPQAPAGECCPGGGAAGAGQSPEAAFGAFIEAVSSKGQLDARTKELIIYSLVVMSRCKPCIEIHRDKALAMGITQAQLDEAAWCAVAIGGAPVRMSYLEDR